MIVNDDRPVSELGEDELIASFAPLLPRGRRTLVPTGDDAAVVAAEDGRYVVTTDVLVQDRHFRLEWGGPADVGWRAAAQNLADVAAMGAAPTSLVISLVIPPTTPVSWVHGLCRGLSAICAPLGVGVDGGDLSSGEQIVVAVTAHGTLAGRDPVLRAGARPGDVLAHAGVLGHAAAGYALFEAGESGPAAAPRDSTSMPSAGGELAEVGARFRRAFLRPDPPLAAGPAAAEAGATAMLDLSDGLLRDAGRLARASGVTLDLDGNAMARCAADLEPVATRLGANPFRWALTGGEDHGLLATFPADAALPAGFARIGDVVPVARLADGDEPVLYDGDPPEAVLGAVTTGWDHFGG